MGDGFDEAIEERFRIEAAVGRGAFAEVHRGTDRKTGAPVAVKRLVSTENRANLVRFAREARLLAQIESPYVVRYVAHGRDGAGRPCLVLEWLDGPDLARLRRSRPVSVGDAITITRQAALGLHALHLTGVVHRDVKPANFVLVSSATEGIRIKLIDLGVARVQAEPQMTQDGYAVGTLSYMSPEQIRCEPSLTPQSDLFSLGVTLYELLSGVRPFADRDANALLAKILLHDPVRVRSRTPAVSLSLDESVHRALAKRASDRFESARAMADALVAPDGAVTETSADSGPPTVRAGVTADQEQRAVTALFAGFASDTTFDAVTARFREIVTAHRGVVHQFPGFRAIAVFGEEGSRGDEVQWAARAALAARARVAGMRLAIATCKLHAGLSGVSEDAIQSGVEQLGRAGETILIDVSTARLLDAGFHVDEVGADRVLRAERAADARSSPKLLGRETTTVGRDRELRTLDAFLDECISESTARALLLTGPAGVGKSRLRHEFLGRVRARVPSVEPLFTRGDPVRAGSPFSLLSQFVRIAARIVDGEPVLTTHRKISSRLARHMAPGDVPRVAEFLSELIGASVSEGASVQLASARRDPVLMADQLRRAWIDWIAAECEAASVVLVIEDLHWGDLPSVKLIENALRSLEQHALFVVAFARPDIHETFPKLWGKTRIEEMRVDGLSRKSAEKLVREVLGDRPGAALVTSLVERAEGNAFYLEELIRATAEGKTDVLPESVLLMVQARLAKLSPVSRRVLRVASVFGEAFWKGALAATLDAEYDAETLTDMLQGLEADEVIVRRATSRFASEEEYVFRHALLREGAYASLTVSDRTLAHRSAADWLEHAGEADAIVLAKHSELGGDATRAIKWYLRAAERALEGDDLDAALSLADRGTTLGAAGAVLGALRLVQGNAHWWRGDLRTSHQAALEALVLLPRPSADWYAAVRLTATVAVGLAEYAWLDELATDLDSLHAEAADDAAYLWASARVAYCLLTRGPCASVDRLLERVKGRGPALAASTPLVASQIVAAEAKRALIMGELGAWRDGILWLASLYESAGSVGHALASQANLGYAHMVFGEYASAERVLREVAARAKRTGHRHIGDGAHHNLGYVLALQGRFDDARAEEMIALNSFREGGHARVTGQAHQYLARVEILAGDYECATREARAAVDLLARIPNEHADSLAVLAHALWLGGRVDEAREVAQRSADLSEGVGGADPQGVYQRWIQATVLNAAGDHDRARRVMTVARSVVLKTAETIKDPTLRASYLERVAENAGVLASPLGAGTE